MEALQLVLMPILMAILEAVKQIPPVKRYLEADESHAWFLPWLAGALGAGFLPLWCHVYPPEGPMSLAAQILNGALLGLAAAGIYKGSIGPIRNAIAPYGPMILLAVVLGLALTAGGCMAPGLSNGQTYILGCQTYATTANSLVVLRNEFSQDEWANIQAIDRQVYGLLQDMRDDLVNGGVDFDFNYTVFRFQRLLDDLLRIQLQAEQAKKEASNVPGGNSGGDGGGNPHDKPVGDSREGNPADRTRADGGRDRRGDETGGGGAPELAV